MKIITTLVLLQTGILLLLFAKIAGIEDAMTPATPGAINTSVTDDLADMQSQNYSRETDLNPNEGRLRQIIREELGAELDRRAEPDKPTDPVKVAGSTDTAETVYQRELVAQQLENFLNVGSISDADMQKLQMDIAKLDDAGRTEMLRELSRAFNSGRLEGRL